MAWSDNDRSRSERLKEMRQTQRWYNGHMELPAADDPNLLYILSCDGDPTIREGDWLRLWNSTGVGIAHDVWVGMGGTVYENSGSGGNVRRNHIGNVLAGRKVIHIVSRTSASDLHSKVAFAESKLNTLWDGFYNCQDFASEVATGTPQSFQRDALIAVSVLAGGLVWWSNQEPPRKQKRRAN